MQDVSTINSTAELHALLPVAMTSVERNAILDRITAIERIAASSLLAHVSPGEMAEWPLQIRTLQLRLADPRIDPEARAGWGRELATLQRKAKAAQLLGYTP